MRYRTYSDKSQFPHFVGFDKALNWMKWISRQRRSQLFPLQSLCRFYKLRLMLIGLFRWQPSCCGKANLLKQPLPQCHSCFITGGGAGHYYWFFFNHYVSVLEVKEEHRLNCRKSVPIRSYCHRLHPDFSAFNKPQVYNGVASRPALPVWNLLALRPLLIDPSQCIAHQPRTDFAGVGNMVSGLFGGLPVTSVIVRSSVNVSSGARTQLAAFIHGVLILLFSFSRSLGLIPLSALAAILILPATTYRIRASLKHV